jgi:hypothetical protein
MNSETIVVSLGDGRIAICRVVSVMTKDEAAALAASLSATAQALSDQEQSKGDEE